MLLEAELLSGLTCQGVKSKLVGSLSWAHGPSQDPDRAQKEQPPKPLLRELPDARGSSEGI